MKPKKNTPFSFLPICVSNHNLQAAFSAKFGDLRTSEQLDQLTAETRRYMLRRMKEDVEKSVPPKEETHVSVELTGKGGRV